MLRVAHPLPLHRPPSCRLLLRSPLQRLRPDTFVIQRIVILARLALMLRPLAISLRLLPLLRHLPVMFAIQRIVTLVLPALVPLRSVISAMPFHQRLHRSLRQLSREPQSRSARPLSKLSMPARRHPLVVVSVHRHPPAAVDTVGRPKQRLLAAALQPHQQLSAAL